MARKAGSHVVFKALGDETRLGIVVALLDREMCACDLPRVVHRAQPTVSLQLKYLVNAGILESKREGKMIYYSLKDKRVNDLLKCIAH